MLTLDGPRANRVPDSLPAAGKASLLLLERRTSAKDDEGGAFFGNRRRQFPRLFGNHGRPASTFLTAVQDDPAVFPLHKIDRGRSASRRADVGRGAARGQHRIRSRSYGTSS